MGLIMENEKIKEYMRAERVFKKVDELIPYARNSRTHSDQQIDQLAANIKEFGFTDDVLITKDNVIMCGHGRILAAKKAGLDEVPCKIMGYMTPTQVKAFIIAHNKISDNAGWDTDMLELEIADLEAEDFNVELLNFDDKELSKIRDHGKEVEEDEKFDLNKALDEKAFVQLGDVWILGKHRLMCGDSTKPDDVKVLMDGNKANICITDPPYNCNIQGGAHEGGKGKEGGLKIMNDSFKSSEDFFNFLLQAFQNVYENLVDGGAFYCFHSDAEKVNFYNATIGAKFHYSTTCIWVKDTLVVGRMDYQMRHEPVLYAFKDTGKHQWYSDRKQTTVWSFDRPKKSELHPTMKPLPLIAYPMKNSSQENGLVIDLFGGSGSTLMVAEQLNRKSFLMELDPKYASAIVRRYVAFKGDTKDVYVLRNGEKKECIEIYNPADDEFKFTEQSVN